LFKIGDKAVYPSHGVGVVESIETRELYGNKKTYYILRILENGMTIMIPTDNVDAVGMREVISEDLVPRVFQILREKRIVVESHPWNRRYREYSEKIKTGSVFEIAEVLRDLNLLKEQKELSYGEKKLMELAKSLLIKEISIASGTKEDKIGKRIDSVFKA